MCLLPHLPDKLHLQFLGRKNALLGVVCVVYAHEIATFVYVICTTEHGVHLLQHDPLCLWDEEVDEDRKQDVDASEHIEGIETTILRAKSDPATRMG
jgi:hypothetical protein